MRTLIANGTVVTAASTYEADVLVDGGRIVQIGRGLAVEDAERVDASGSYVLPGAIDVHTHLDTTFGAYTTVDDWRAGSIGAACGGTTTIVDFALQAKGQTLRETIDGWHAKAEGKAVVDYGFHAMVMDLTDAVRREIPRLIEQEGVPSFKVFMAYKGVVQADDETLLRTLLTAGEHGGLTMVHAENGDAVLVLQERLAEQGKLGIEHWPRSRPPELEAEAAHRAIVLAGVAGAPLYVVHVSCALAAEQIARARAAGRAVYGETCPQYLVLSDERYVGPAREAARYVMAPPLRDRSNQGPLWHALAAGTLQAVGTDHSAWPVAGYKDRSLDDFRFVIQGAPGIETRLPVLYTYGVLAGRLSLNRFVEVTATGPARLFGLHPQKGDVAIGSDADLVVWDPSVEWTLTHDAMHGNTDYCTFEGMPVRGAPALVLSRGRVVVRDREYVGGEGGGRFLHRAPFDAP